jgi:hypothetical protein
MVKRIVVILMVVLAGWPSLAMGQSKDSMNTSGSLREEVIADIKEMSSRCSTFARPECRDWNDINEHRPSANGVMVAEDMRCRQCRGKCKAEELRCRSQCVGESGCLAQCEERSSQCEAMCKQIFQCE